MSPELREAIAQVKSGLRTEENIEKVQRAIECEIIDHEDISTVPSIQEECIEALQEALKHKSINLPATLNNRLSLVAGKQVKVNSHRLALCAIVALLEKQNV